MRRGLILVGGVGELFQGDLDVGRVVVERLATEPFGDHVVVEDLSYGAIAVHQRLDELKPAALVLIGATRRGRPPGSLTRQRVGARHLSADDAQAAVRDAGTGYVDVDLLLAVASAFGSLPARTVVFEVEPGDTTPGDRLSAAVLSVVDDTVEAVRREVDRGPLLELADDLRPMVGDNRLVPGGALDAVRALLSELERLDREGHWGAAFRWRDSLRLQIAAGEVSEGMEHLDWALWWALIEELDRLQAQEAAS